LLWTREIRTQVINHTRRYFVNEAIEKKSKKEASSNSRTRGLNSSFSSVGVLMPGRKPSARGKKRSTKTQASVKTKEKKAGV